MLHKSKTPFIRDVYLAYLIEGASRTKTDEFPIIESWMVSNIVPKEIVQWDRRQDVIDYKNTAICFYCHDYRFTPILGNPKAYVEKLKKYQMILGLDASPYDNMPLVVQKSQIYLNLATTYFFAKSGIKVILNIRLGDDRTFSSLEAYPKHTLISIGTNGFIKTISNQNVLALQVKTIINYLQPVGIIVYGKALNIIFDYAVLKGIPVYQYDSYVMKENQKDRNKRMNEVIKDER